MVNSSPRQPKMEDRVTLSFDMETVQMSLERGLDKKLWYIYSM